MDNDIILLQSSSSSVGVCVHACVSEMWVMQTERQWREDEIDTLRSFFYHTQIFSLNGNVTVNDPYLSCTSPKPSRPPGCKWQFQGQE